jgi:hypothetical protein
MALLAPLEQWLLALSAPLCLYPTLVSHTRSAVLLPGRSTGKWGFHVILSLFIPLPMEVEGMEVGQNTLI